ncbi:hypothetical protein QLQ12_17650 [Actinoplanes sp. NEAU-A12]|uniref:Uncharacterized protein n=1 Tax=Actinoplanes sandaracinus TaxID=3045177 RepID=A0ABT6WL22_9ACTN|nr:hypothetical protein [Actinoplanes sandaracinus]MDI6100436.1 hypothetical protein [Actinoplanes sandaracinus]
MAMEQAMQVRLAGAPLVGPVQGLEDVIAEVLEMIIGAVRRPLAVLRHVSPMFPIEE